MSVSPKLTREQFVESAMRTVDRHLAADDVAQYRPVFEQEAGRYFDAGWALEDVRAMFLSHEELNPSLDEDVALARMDALNAKYDPKHPKHPRPCSASCDMEFRGDQTRGRLFWCRTHGKWLTHEPDVTVKPQFASHWTDKFLPKSELRTTKKHVQEVDGKVNLTAQKLRLERLMNVLGSTALQDLEWIFNDIRQYGYYCDGGAMAGTFHAMVWEEQERRRADAKKGGAK